MTRKEEIQQASFEYHSKPYLGAIKDDFVNGAEWADEHPKEGMVSIDKACDFIKVNAYKYGKIKISMHGLPSFDFRTDTFINDLKQMLEE